MKKRSSRGAWLVWGLIWVLGGCASVNTSAPTDTSAGDGYGAVAYAPSTQDWVLRWRVIKPERARQRALADCAVADCQVILEFGPGQCGTLALGPTSFGAGQGDTPAVAEAMALDECGSQEQSCRVVPAECNR